MATTEVDAATPANRWRLPRMRGLAMRIYVAVWLVMLIAAIMMPVVGLYLVRAAPVEASGLEYDGTGFTRWSADLVGDAGALLVPLALAPAAMLLFRQRADPVPALLSIAMLIISATSFFGAFATDALGLVATAPALLWLGWAGIILALLCFPHGRLEPRWTVIVAGMLLAQLIAVELALLPGNADLLGWVALLALAVAALAARYRRLPPGVERQQLRWVFLGFAIGVILFGAGMVILAGEPLLVALDRRWIVWIEVTVTPLAALGLVSFALGLMVSLLRYRLYDADVVISRSAAYGVLTLGFVTLFASLGKAIELIGERWFSGSFGWGAGVIGVGLAALVVVPLHDGVVRWAERRFQPGLVALRREIPRAVFDARETEDSDGLLAIALDRIADSVGAARGAALVADGDGWRIAATRGAGVEETAARLAETELDGASTGLARIADDALLPARLPLRNVEDRPPIGWLLLGPRPDGSFYGADEQQALEEIAAPIARSLAIVREREAREAATSARIGSIERSLAEIAARLDAMARTIPPAAAPR